MGGFSAQVQQGQTSGGKLGPIEQASQPTMPTIQGANGVVTNSATSGQPTIGAANQYSNTIGQVADGVAQPQQQFQFAGKGQGAQGFRSNGGLGKGA